MTAFNLPDWQLLYSGGELTGGWGVVIGQDRIRDEENPPCEKEMLCAITWNKRAKHLKALE